MTLGDIIKEYREKHNISMDEFSKISNLSKGYISMLENNTNPRNNKPIAPTLPTIRKIASAMSMDVDSILKILDSDQEINLDFEAEKAINGRNMLKLYQNIKRLREERGLSQDALAKLTGYTDRSSITKIEKGQIDLQQSKIELFAKALGTTSRELVGCDEEDSLILLNNIYPIELKRFPLLGQIACGKPTYAAEDRESYIMAGTDINADFCLKAKGDSMVNARILDGDIVFVRKQDIVDNGEIAVVVVNNDSEATLKRFYYYAEKNMVILKAENPAYEDLIFTNDELNNFHVLGKAVAFQSDVR
jgi:repressor LexA